VIYTTAIEALNRQLRKATKTKGSFPSEEAAIKLLYLLAPDKRGGLRKEERPRSGGDAAVQSWRLGRRAPVRIVSVASDGEGLEVIGQDRPSCPGSGPGVSFES
jgi:hypothetical protein